MKRLIVLLTLFCVAMPAFSQPDLNFFKHRSDFTDRFIDLRDYLFAVAEHYDISLIIAQDVKTRVKQVKGRTIGDVLNNFLAGTGFTYKLNGTCLYVAAEDRLDSYFANLSEDATMLPRGKGNIPISGYFKSIEIAIFFKILRSITGVELRATENLRSNLVLRLNKMPWKDVLVAIVRLNNFKMYRTEFSVVVDKE